MSISIPCRGLRLQLIVVTGCLLAMVAMIVTSPSQLRYDEQGPYRVNPYCSDERVAPRAACRLKILVMPDLFIPQFT